jgi:zinc transporter ZupT
LGIGLHNFGEGLAIGAAFATNKAAFSLFLIVGFALHNVTEGLGVVAPLSTDRTTLLRLVVLAALAGLPVVPGIYLGTFSTSAHFSAMFFGIGAGAILQVIVAIHRFAKERVGMDSGRARINATSVAGYFAGAGVMALTAMLITI